MGGHPLDISHILLKKGVELQEKYPPKKQKKEHKKEKQVPKPQPTIQQEQVKTEPKVEERVYKIEQQYWTQLNTESRKILTSQAWKNVDFNSMLKELDDLSKLSEKWLRWAIPTYVNGLKGGPIKDWLDGNSRENDFHYVLVGEHLRYFKDIREQKKKEQDDLTSLPETEQHDPDKEKYLEESITELTEHINWFQEYIDKQTQA
jgi:hypothetical protein